MRNHLASAQSVGGKASQTHDRVDLPPFPVTRPDVNRGRTELHCYACFVPMGLAGAENVQGRLTEDGRTVHILCVKGAAGGEQLIDKGRCKGACQSYAASHSYVGGLSNCSSYSSDTSDGPRGADRTRSRSLLFIGIKKCVS